MLNQCMSLVGPQISTIQGPLSSARFDYMLGIDGIWHLELSVVGHLPEAGEVVAALPLLDVGGGDVVDQVFLLRELPPTVAPLAS